MSKNKNRNVEAQAIDIAGQTPDEVTAVPEPSRITTEAEAIAFVKKNYTVPEGCTVVLVTEDRNVFWEKNAGSATNHAVKHNLKLFRLSCQDLVK